MALYEYKLLIKRMVDTLLPLDDRLTEAEVQNVIGILESTIRLMYGHIGADAPKAPDPARPTLSALVMRLLRDAKGEPLHTARLHEMAAALGAYSSSATPIQAIDALLRDLHRRGQPVECMGQYTWRWVTHPGPASPPSSPEPPVLPSEPAPTPSYSPKQQASHVRAMAAVAAQTTAQRQQPAASTTKTTTADQQSPRKWCPKCGRELVKGKCPGDFCDWVAPAD